MQSITKLIVSYLGVMRVRRNFIDSLWNETTTLEELDWKSLARRKLITFEDELHQGIVEILIL